MIIIKASNIKSRFLLILLFATYAVYGNNDLDNSDFGTPGVDCPAMNRCRGYRNNLSYMDRSCECGYLCAVYGDCCIDASARFRNNMLSRNSYSRRPKTSSARSSMMCLHYGVDRHTGVYAISKCSNAWNGPKEVQEKCIGPVDYSDPLKAAPMTNAALSLTYRNIYCAECNNANMLSLTTFQMRITCEGLQDLVEEQILGDLSYDAQTDHWGVYRLNKNGNATVFVQCRIEFEVPGYLNNSVRFCRSNLISKCAEDWKNPEIQQHCSEYMAVVYDDNVAYKNPHCTLCNHKSIKEISCKTEESNRKRPMSFALLLDVNQSDGDQVGMRRVATPSCPYNHKYDPFFKKCRQLVCALPGHVVVNGRCVRE